jgi:hypothetical protein
MSILAIPNFQMNGVLFLILGISGSGTVEGYDQCYTCGVGKDCMVGNVVRKHGVLEKIEKNIYR